MISSKAQELLQTINSKLSAHFAGVDILELCFTKHENNPDRFTECYRDKVTKMEKLSERMESRLLFSSLKLAKCLQTND
jgi:hypothetical protein